MQRVDWTDLPEAVRDAVGQHCGGIKQVTPVTAGINNALACTLDAHEGALFLKGIPSDSPRAWMFRNEIAAAGARAPGPRQRWHLDIDGWTLIGWEHQPGRHADLAPGSPDLDRIAAALWELADTPPLDTATARAFAPEARRWERMRPWQHLAAEPPEDLDPWVRAGLDEFANAECDALHALAGDRLVHTDIHPCNVLIDQRAHLIDWAWARPGAPWMDAELVAFRLVAAGHTSAEADRWRLQHLPHADLAPEIRSAFATEMLGTWLHLAERQPSRPLLRQNAAAALRWAKHLNTGE